MKRKTVYSNILDCVGVKVDDGILRVRLCDLLYYATPCYTILPTFILFIRITKYDFYPILSVKTEASRFLPIIRACPLALSRWNVLHAQFLCSTRLLHTDRACELFFFMSICGMCLGRHGGRRYAG